MQKYNAHGYSSAMNDHQMASATPTQNATKKGHKELDAASLREHEEFTKFKNIATIELGRYEIESHQNNFRDICKKLQARGLQVWVSSLLWPTCNLFFFPLLAVCSSILLLNEQANDCLGDSDPKSLVLLLMGVHTCRRANVSPGTNVLITGVGPTGLVTMLAARAFGAPRIIMIDVDDLDVAEELLCVHKAMNNCMDVTRPGGKVCLVGLGQSEMTRLM
ncbi:hypothetical protein ACET3Z_005288 [Daucus carota]